MTRSIVMIGNESPAFTTLRLEALLRVERIHWALVPTRFALPVQRAEQEQSDSAERSIRLPLNGTSPLACHTLALDIANKLGQVSEFFLVCSPVPLRACIKDAKPADLDRLCDDLLKMWLFMAREAYTLLSAQGTGKLCLVLTDEIEAVNDGDAPDIAGPLLTASFKAFADSLLVQSNPSGVQVLAFSSHETAGMHSVAAHCFKILDEDRSAHAGKWHRAGRPGLFNPRK